MQNSTPVSPITDQNENNRRSTPVIIGDVVTKTTVGTASITVTGIYASETNTTAKDITKMLITRHISGGKLVDL